MGEVVQARRGREGSRWINQRPTPHDVAEWFKTVELDEGMEHETWVAGITVIQGTEKVDEIVGYDEGGYPIVREKVPTISFTPYMKIETRVAYFWRLMAMHREEWVGSIEPVLPDGKVDLGLPPGFFRFTAQKPDNKTVSFVGQSMIVKVVERDSAEWREVVVNGKRLRILEGKPVWNPPPASKIVATATKWDVDPNSLLKAETGAIGRALGFAGILVLPGSGIATAEDMQDLATPVGATDPVAPAVPAATIAAPPAVDLAAPAAETGAPDGDPALRRQAAEILRELEAYPNDLKLFQEWARGRRFRSLNELVSPALKGVVRKLEKTLDEAKRRDQAPGGGEDAGSLDGS